MRISSPALLACVLLAATSCLVPAVARAARDPAPGFLEQSLDLPGIPATVIPADMNSDGRDDLVVLVAYTTWDTVSKTERVSFDDIEGLVEVMSVVSALLDRRELRVYTALEEGGFSDNPLTLALDTSVHALEAGHQTEPLMAITDEGAAAVRLQRTADGERLALVPVLATSTAFSGTGVFYADLRLLHDLDSDGRTDIVLPTTTGWSVHRGTPTGFESDPAAQLAAPVAKMEDDESETDDEEANDEPPNDDDAEHRDGRHVHIEVDDGSDVDGDGDSDDPDRGDSEDDTDTDAEPRIRALEGRDINGDEVPDLLLPASRRIGPVVYLNRGNLEFAPAVELELHDGAPEFEEIAFVGDLDGDARAEVVSQEEIELPDDAGFRQEINEAKRPHFTYRLYQLGADLSLATEPYRTFGAIGYVFHGGHDDEVDIELPGGFKDLDGDGREDLVAITLDFSLVPLIVRALIIQSISLRMDFHPWCQRDDGGFAQVPDLDLSGKFKINFRNVQLKHLSQFAGDFNGDGRKDFVQLGRGRKVTIHQGDPECSYPRKPDRRLRFEREPRHLGLVRILDLDANGRSDIYVVHPLRDPDTGESIPVRLDLYLSESAYTE